MATSALLLAYASFTQGRKKAALIDLLLGVCINSGNDGSNAIAVIVSGTVDNFVRRMNERAAELGCTGTHFANAHGYT